MPNKNKNKQKNYIIASCCSATLLCLALLIRF
jgi:hypothetical protein